MIEWMSYGAAGLVAGLIAGLFGVGGGLVIVPVLVWVFGWQGMTPDISMHVAVGTSLTTICVTALSSTLAHHRYATVDWRLVTRLAPALILGGLGGALIAGQLSGQWLRTLFAVFAVLVALRLWLPQPTRVSAGLVSLPALGIFGVMAGIISAMVGIGGGSLVVPYLAMAGQQMQRAVGTAAACGLPIAFSGVVGFILVGMHVHQIEAAWQTGFVHWQAFIGIVSLSVICAPLGARLASKLPARRLRQAFSVMLLLLGTSLFVQ